MSSNAKARKSVLWFEYGIFNNWRRNAIINAHLVEKGELVMAPVKIGNGALIGGNSTVQPGCTIGEGAVVANRAVLPKWTDIPAGEVWGGVPAKCIRQADGTKPE